MIEEWGESGSGYEPTGQGVHSMSSIVFMHTSHAEHGAQKMTIPRLAAIIRSLTTVELDSLIRELGPDFPGLSGGVREPRRPIRPRLGAGAVLDIPVVDEEQEA